MGTEMCKKCEANTYNAFEAWVKWNCKGEKPEDLAIWNMYQQRIDNCTESHS
jgi:hypothetical protein